MSDEQDMPVREEPKVPGTNIPSDPRKRTKNHGRLEISVWLEMDDDALEIGKFKDACDALRHIEDGIGKEIQGVFNEFSSVPLIGDYRFHTATRVSK
jgi:hypothetical protein